MEEKVEKKGVNKEGMLTQSINQSTVQLVSQSINQSITQGRNKYKRYENRRKNYTWTRNGNK